MAPPILNDISGLRDHIQQVTGDLLLKQSDYPESIAGLKEASAVMFLLGCMPGEGGEAPEPCLILNKRSEKVTQPGDLCCPGGGVSPGIDTFIAKFMTLPGLPMGNWRFWPGIRTRRPRQAEILRILMFTSLRESVEEMRLNPFRIQFLGPLPVQCLVMFGRVIYPMVGWYSGRRRFAPNWEVEKIVTIPLRQLLNPENYVRYQLDMNDPSNNKPSQRVYDAPSFLHADTKASEVLWGATCRITLSFLELVFGFSIPDTSSLPVRNSILSENYLTGHPK